MNNFYNQEELKEIGLKNHGKNVSISRKCSIYGAENISIGNNVRIDDFCILSGHITIGNYVHISAYSALYGNFGIVLEDFSGISPHCTILSGSDDFSGEYLINPTVPSEFTNVTGGVIHLSKYTQIGVGTVIMPNVTIGEGSVIGAKSLVLKSTGKWGIYIGTPVNYLKPRKKTLLTLSERCK